MATAEGESLSRNSWLGKLERTLLSREECLQRLKELQKVVEMQEYFLLATGHMVRFFTNDLWSGLSEEWRSCLLELSDAALANLPAARLVEPCSSASFTSFVEHVGRYSFPRQQTPLAAELLANQVGMFIDHQMKPKKSHEVELLAALTSQIAQCCQLQQVVDVGSGKGYLSETLARQYSLRVVGIDASETNVHGAERRNALLGRFWHGLVRRRERQAKEGSPCKLSRKQGDHIQSKDMLSTPSLSLPVQEQDAAVRDEAHSVNDIHTSSGGIKCSSVCNLSSDLCLQSVVSGEESHQCPACPPATEEALASTPCANNLSSEACGVSPVEHAVLPHTVCGAEGSLELSSQSQSHAVVAGYVRDDGDDFIDFLARSGGSCVNTRQPFLLAGLHTCGNLAASSLRLFCRCPALQALCTVGCCYHLVTESEEAEAATADGTVEDRLAKTDAELGHDWRGQGSSNPGFPLSKTVQRMQPCLGINARMLACQAPDRMAAPGQVPPHTGIFWRAIFQVMLVEKFKKQNSSRGNNVGRQFAKSKSFHDYVRRCLSKLQIPQEQITDEEISHYLEHFQPRLRELQAFAQLRAMVSSVIESLILLDRVCYLLEQPNIQLAGALPLFDPVTSPRNVVICAVKSSA